MAGIRLPAIIGDNMVLQKGIPAPIWGWASPGKTIRIVFRDQTISTTVPANGKWMIRLGSYKSGGPYEMEISGDGPAITIHNILVGEVWLASGQSNMEFGIQTEMHSAAGIASATDSLIHFFYVPMASSLHPEEDVAPVPQGSLNARWVVCSPALLAASWAWHGFSAAGYYFAKEIRKSTGSPVGMIGSYKGATPAQAWVSIPGLQQDLSLARHVAVHQKLLDQYDSAKTSYPKKQADFQTALRSWDSASGKPKPRPPTPPDGGFGPPANCYNAMIAPIVPYGIRGVIWYQGESNGDRIADACEYPVLFPRLITDWREKWGEGNFTFLFAQLASYRAAAKTASEGIWPWVREAQTRTLTLPKTGMAVITDIGDSADIHPKNKLDVGIRLALAARHVAYGENIIYTGPVYRSMRIKGKEITVSFTGTLVASTQSVPVSTGTSANPLPAATSTAASSLPVTLKGFGIAGADKKFVWAKAVLNGNTVTVSSDDVKEPVAVRYNWADNPPGDLHNKEGLPAGSFRTDNWECAATLPTSSASTPVPTSPTMAQAMSQAPDPRAPDYVKAPLQPWEKKFESFQFRTLEKEGHVLPYRVYAPPTMEPGKKYPLVVFFHGAGERGLDNRYQFFRWTPSPFWEKYPCYIIAPQCPPKTAGGPDGESVWVQTPFGAPSHSMKERPSWPMQLAMEAIDKLIAENSVDLSRIYVTGLSMGGFATWEILQREPGKFAAAMPVCGGGDTAFAAALVNIPIWVFHGDADSTVPVKRSRNMVAAIAHAGGHPKYTEYPGVGHGAWAKTYPDPEVWDWLFAQSRKPGPMALPGAATSPRSDAQPSERSSAGTSRGTSAGPILHLNPLFGDNMILQRNRKEPVWGWGMAGQEVVIGFKGRSYKTTVPAAGKWKIDLDAGPAGGPYEMTIQCAAEKISIKNILVGDVWLCSGQSNMVLDFNNDRVKALYAADIDSSANDQIRQILVARSYSAVPSEDFGSSGWKLAGPKTLPSFTAAGYFFARALYEKYHVPVGIINSSNGGTVAEAWTSEEGLKELPQFGKDMLFLKDTAAVNEKIRSTRAAMLAKGAKTGVYDAKNLPTALYNAMIAPLEPYAIKGVVWYQGEYNTHKAYEYRTLFPALIRDWRSKWSQGNFPFIYQQLPNFQLPVQQPSENEWAELREAQRLTLAKVPNTAMAVAIDIGGVNELHPSDKKDIGCRLALQAEKIAYGEKKIVSSGPLYQSMKVSGDKIIIRFSDTGKGLAAKGGGELKYFSIAGEDQKFVWADAAIKGNTVEVSNKQIAHPVAVRYAWAGDPAGANLYNSEGLPASPFRTDEWPGLTDKN